MTAPSAVTITGAGLVTPFGHHPGCLVDPPHRPRQRRFVDEDAAPQLKGRKGLRTFSREAKLLLTASLLACEDAKMETRGWDGQRVGIFCGTTTAGLEDYLALYQMGVTSGRGTVSPGQGPQTGLNAPAAAVAIQLDAQGPNITVSAGRTSGLAAVIEARWHLEAGRADVGLTGGVDVLSRQLAPGTEPWPTWSEGAAVVVLERESHRVARGAQSLLSVVGSGSSFDPAAPSRAAADAVTDAVAEAGPAPAAAVVAGDGGPDETVAASIVGEAALHRIPAAAGSAPGLLGALGVVWALQLVSQTPQRWPGDVLVTSCDPSGTAAAVVLRPAQP